MNPFHRSSVIVLTGGWRHLIRGESISRDRWGEARQGAVRGRGTAGGGGQGRKIRGPSKPLIGIGFLSPWVPFIRFGFSPIWYLRLLAYTWGSLASRRLLSLNWSDFTVEVYISRETSKKNVLVLFINFFLLDVFVLFFSLFRGVLLWHPEMIVGIICICLWWRVSFVKHVIFKSFRCRLGHFQRQLYGLGGGVILPLCHSPKENTHENLTDRLLGLLK